MYMEVSMRAVEAMCVWSKDLTQMYVLTMCCPNVDGDIVDPNVCDG